MSGKKNFTWKIKIINFKNSDFCKLLRLPISPIFNFQNSIISFGYVDFYAKIFLILYPWSWNSITGNAIMSRLLLTSWIVKAREDLSRRPQINKNDGHILLQLCFTTCSWTLEVFSLAVQLFIVDSIMQPWGQLVSDNYYTMINCRDMVCFQWKGNNICQFKSLVSNINNIGW